MKGNLMEDPGVLPPKNREQKLAESIRAKRATGATLTPTEEAYFLKKSAEEKEDDNPYRNVKRRY